MLKTNKFTHGSNVINERFPNNVNLSMLTIGGNNVGFDNIIKECLSFLSRNINDCENRILKANESLDNPSDLKAKIIDILKALQRRMRGSDSYVVLVGYPLLAATPSRFQKILCEINNKYCEGFLFNSSVRQLGVKADRFQKDVINEWNKDQKIP